MDHSTKVGFCFGITSGIITTLGLMVGLNSGTHSIPIVIGGILTIAIADSFSDALGIHMSEESENKHSAREIWRSTISTFFTKFSVALTFLVPVMLLELSTAIIVSAAWGYFLLIGLSYFLAKSQNEKAWKVIGEHAIIATVVIFATHYAGKLISLAFA